MVIAELLAEADTLFARYDAIPEDDLSRRADEDRAFYEQKGFDMLRVLVAALHIVTGVEHVHHV